MTQSLNKPFTLHLSNVRGRKTNTSYPYEALITCPADLMKAAKFDHTAGLFKDGKNSKGGMITAHRAIKDFVEEDCVITDCDNKENNPMLPDIPPEEWKTPEDVHKAFPDVEFIAIPSRNHMKEKNGLPARPKHHYYFPRSRKAETAGDSAKLRNSIIEHFPQFDEKAKGPAHFMFGIGSPLEPIYYPGEICIDEFMQQLEQRVNDEAAVIPDGCRNATLSRYAFSMLKRFGMDDGTTESLFYQKATHCEPPLDDSELSTIWNSAVSGYKEKVLSNPDYVDPANSGGVAAWAKANPALGSIKKLDDLNAKVERAKQNRNELSGVLCKEFNVRETVKTAWLSFDDINNESTFDLEAFRGAYCIGGVDLSITTDLTCASLLFMHRGDDHKYIKQMYWIPADRLTERLQQDKIPYGKWFDRGLLRLCTGNSINYSNVTAWFVETVKQYDLFPAWVYYDSYSARYFVEEMQMQGFNIVRCIQGAKTLSLPMQMLGADLQAHKVIYNNNPVLKWCLTNTGVQTDRNGNIVPIKNQSPKQRIDGTAALLDCYVGLYEHYNEYTTAI